MFIGESFAIQIQIVEPEINLQDATAITIRVMNNKIFVVDYTLAASQVTIERDDDDNYTIAEADMPRTDSLKLAPGQMEIEMLVDMDDDPSFPDGMFRIAQVIEPVLQSFTTNL